MAIYNNNIGRDNGLWLLGPSDGYIPVLADVKDGARTVRAVVDWTPIAGVEQGPHPANPPVYLRQTALADAMVAVQDIADATDVADLRPMAPYVPSNGIPAALAVPAVPASNCAVGGAASGINTYPGDFGPAYAFDSSDSTRWAASGATGTLGYNRGDNKGAVPGAITLYPANSYGSAANDAPRSFIFKARTNGGAWTTLLTVTNYAWANTNPNKWTFANSASFTEFALEVSAIAANGQNLSLRKIEILSSFTEGTSGTVKSVAALNLNQIENPMAASSVGAVTKKIEVFDANGMSLGFIALYSSIT